MAKEQKNKKGTSPCVHSEAKMERRKEKMATKEIALGSRRMEMEIFLFLTDQ